MTETKEAGIPESKSNPAAHFLEVIGHVEMNEFGLNRARQSSGLPSVAFYRLKGHLSVRTAVESISDPKKPGQKPEL